MNAKKVQDGSVVKNKRIKSSINFFASIKQELKQVSWTSKKELMTFTKVILISTFLIGMLIYFFDLSIQSVLNLINSFVRLIGG